MKDISRTASLPNDTLVNYHNPNVTLNTNELLDAIVAAERFLNYDHEDHENAKNGAIAFLQAIRAAITGNDAYANGKRDKALRIAELMKIKVTEALPKPVSTTRKDDTL